MNSRHFDDARLHVIQFFLRGKILFDSVPNILQRLLLRLTL